MNILVHTWEGRAGETQAPANIGPPTIAWSKLVITQVADDKIEHARILSSSKRETC